jgi:phosphatidylethanolamine/phosphatidyl-N-methylethanolamine N-methyltransferase|tara:strand:- start:2869 stop:3585 length:717 start_codon:yes stop_codon:yes gene_type:complete
MLRRSELIFFSRWLRDPLKVGSVLPSGKALASMLAKQVPIADGKYIVELGGGTGTVTDALLSTGLDPSRLIIFERDPQFHARLTERFSDSHVVHGDARDLGKLLGGMGIESVGAVVSGLPLLSMSSHVQRPIFEQSFQFLDRDGVFLQFTYGLTSPVSQSLIQPLGLVAEKLGMIWQNVPPATVWRYTQDRRPEALQVIPADREKVSASGSYANISSADKLKASGPVAAKGCTAPAKG